MFHPLLLASMTTETLPLIFERDHLYVRVGNHLWLYDTGADRSFGDTSFAFCGKKFNPATDYMGINAGDISGFLGETVLGIIGADALSVFDHIIDLRRRVLTVSTDALESIGAEQSLTFFMAVPLVAATVAGQEVSLFFDTGAQISYYQEDVDDSYPVGGVIEDFFPGTGQFTSDTHILPTSLNGITHSLRYGQLAGMMGMAIRLAGASGILGNDVIRDRVTGYFPRRSLLMLEP